MKCPICKTDLIVEGQKYLETLDEHVSCVDPSLKDSYVCPNKECSAYNAIMWNSWGERYDIKYNEIKHVFINNNDGPFESFQRKCNVEVYKHDEDKNILNVKICNNAVRLELYYSYISNEDGDILKRSRHLRLWINRVHYISGFRMLKFSIKQFHRQLKYDKNIDISLSDWEKKDWWRVAAYHYENCYLKLFKQP